MWDEKRMQEFKKSRMRLREKAEILGEPIGCDVRPYPEHKVIVNINCFDSIENFEAKAAWIDKELEEQFYQLWLRKDCFPKLPSGDTPWHMRFILVRKDELREQFTKYNLGVLPSDELWT